MCTCTGNSVLDEQLWTSSDRLPKVSTVICTTGTTAFPSSRWQGGTPDEIDNKGVKSIVDAAVANGVERFVLVSSQGVERTKQVETLIARCVYIDRTNKFRYTILYATSSVTMPLSADPVCNSESLWRSGRQEKRGNRSCRVRPPLYHFQAWEANRWALYFVRRQHSSESDRGKPPGRADCKGGRVSGRNISHCSGRRCGNEPEMRSSCQRNLLHHLS